MNNLPAKAKENIELALMFLQPIKGSVTIHRKMDIRMAVEFLNRALDPNYKKPGEGNKT